MRPAESFEARQARYARQAVIKKAAYRRCAAELDGAINFWDEKSEEWFPDPAERAAFLSEVGRIVNRLYAQGAP